MTTATQTPAATETIVPAGLDALMANQDAFKDALKKAFQDPEMKKKLKEDPELKDLRKVLAGPTNPGIRTETREQGHAEMMVIAKRLGLDTHSHIGHIQQISSKLKGSSQSVSVLLNVKGHISKSGGVRMYVPVAAFGGVNDPKFLAEIERVKEQQLKIALGGLVYAGIEPAAIEEKKADEETKTDDK